jgi:hypothetical protein
MHHDAFEKSMSFGLEKNSELMLHFGTSVEEFYVKMIGEKLMRYRKLCQTYQKFHYHMSSMNNSTIAEKGAIDQLEWIRIDEYQREGQLMEMYQTEQLSELFMLIYQVGIS